MIRRLMTASILISLIASPLAAQEQEPLPIQRIFLYKNGMAYIMRGGQIEEPMRLSFHPDEMNDVLKTFTAWNPESGRLYSLGYTTGVPVDQILGRYPFDLRSSGGLAGFLKQVAGAPILLDLGPRNTLQGRLLSISPGKRAAGETLVDDHRLSLIQETSGELRSVWLSEVRSLKFEDSQLERQMQSYLRILAEGTQDVTKEVSIYPNPGPGPIRAAYLQQFPVWKTSYRLQFEEGKESASKGTLEGWAMIDNPTGESWQDVELTLIAGMPVSFVMDLYQPLYSHRQVVPVPGQMTPEVAYNFIDEAQTPESSMAMEMRSRSPAPAAKRGPTALGALAFEGAPAGEFDQALGNQLVDYFEYKFPFPVQLAGRQSAFLPFLRKPVSAERLSIYNAALGELHPRSGVRLTNDSGVPLEAGPVTIFEQGRYGGEAVLEYTPRQQDRLLSYGVDFEVTVALRRKARPETVVGVKVNEGVIELTAERIRTTRYELRSRSQRDKTVLIEHPRSGGRLGNVEPDETTEAHYRFRVPLSPGQERELAVPEVLSQRRVLQLNDADPERIEVFFSGWSVPPGLKTQLDRILDLRAQISRKNREEKALGKRMDAISSDQERIRNNLKALGRSGSEEGLRQRYVGELSSQEDQLGQLRRDRRQRLDEIDRLRAEFSRQVRQLNWESR